MKNKFFEFIQIEEKVFKAFCDCHEEMYKFFDPTAPFTVRIGMDLYSTLLHSIITSTEPEEVWSVRLALFSQQLDHKIVPKKVYKLNGEIIDEVLGPEKAPLIRYITKDIVEGKLDLKELAKLPEQKIYERLAVYPKITMTAIKSFAIFGCFKQNVLFFEEPAFEAGLKIFLNKKEITKKDIDTISKEYSGHLTLFSMCMFRLNNEKNRSK